MAADGVALTSAGSERELAVHPHGDKSERCQSHLQWKKTKWLVWRELAAGRYNAIVPVLELSCPAGGRAEAGWAALLPLSRALPGSALGSIVVLFLTLNFFLFLQFYGIRFSLAC